MITKRFLSPIEYCGIQRSGKSTLMVRDLFCKLFYVAGYRPEDTFTNFRIHEPGIHCLSNKDLIEAVFQIKRNKERDKVILFDEAGQELRARESQNKVQTEFVTFAWQMPKRGIFMAYCSNPGNSADVILRLATAQTIMPTYHHRRGSDGYTRDDYIDIGVLFNWDLKLARFRISNVAYWQTMFDTLEPID